MHNSRSYDTITDMKRFFTAGSTSFAVIVDDPLILVAISKLGETEGQVSFAHYSWILTYTNGFVFHLASNTVGRLA